MLPREKSGEEEGEGEKKRKRDTAVSFAVSPYPRREKRGGKGEATKSVRRGRKKRQPAHAVANLHDDYRGKGERKREELGWLREVGKRKKQRLRPVPTGCRKGRERETYRNREEGEDEKKEGKGVARSLHFHPFPGRKEKRRWG